MFRSPFWSSSSSLPAIDTDADSEPSLGKVASMLTVLRQRIHRKRSASESQVQFVDNCGIQEERDIRGSPQWRKVPGGGVKKCDKQASCPDLQKSDAPVAARAVVDDDISKTRLTQADPESASSRDRSQARNQQEQIIAAFKHCNSCEKRFSLFNRKRLCQNCQKFFCNKCAPTGYFSRDRLCIDCLSNHAKAKNFRPNSETMCCSTAHTRVLSESVLRPEPADSRVAPEGKLNIRDLERQGVQLPWEFDGPVPQSIFRVRDREVAFNLSIADSKCLNYKTQLKPTKGCKCHPQLKNVDGIQSVEFALAGPAWCSSIRLDMQFTRQNEIYASVRVASRDTFFTGIVKVDVKRVQRSVSDVEIMFVDDLSVKCTNVSNPGDPNDSITVLGSFAWKLYHDSQESGKLYGNPGVGSPFTCPESPLKSRVRANVETVRTALRKSRKKLLDDLDHAVRDEKTFLDQFNKFEKELQCRTNSMAGANESSVTGADGGELPAHLKLSTDELSTQDLKLAKDAAWCQKEQMTFRRRKLAVLADQTETLKAMIGSIGNSSAHEKCSDTGPSSDPLRLHIPCPSCGLSIQCELA